MRLLEQLARVKRNNGLRGTAEAVLTRMEDMLFDWRYGIDTSGRIALSDLLIESPHVEHGADYVPTQARYFRLIMRALEVPQSSVLVDFGSGKGRVLLLAAQSGRFKKAVGVEFSTDLCRAAERNIRVFQDRRGANVQFEVVNADAADYEVQPDQNVFFMANPFDIAVMESILEQIERSLVQQPRPILLICYCVRGHCMELIRGRGSYIELQQLRYGCARVVILGNQLYQLWNSTVKSASDARVKAATTHLVN